MAGLIIGVVLVVAGVYIIENRFRARLHNVDGGVRYVTKRLAASDGTAPTRIRIWQAHPLVEEQIKDIAESHGFDYVTSGTDGGTSSSLTFNPPESRKRHA